jgi:hypothetical protein
MKLLFLMLALLPLLGLQGMEKMGEEQKLKVQLGADERALALLTPEQARVLKACLEKGLNQERSAVIEPILQVLSSLMTKSELNEIDTEVLTLFMGTLEATTNSDIESLDTLEINTAILKFLAYLLSLEARTQEELEKFKWLKNWRNETEVSMPKFINSLELLKLSVPFVKKAQQAKILFINAGTFFARYREDRSRSKELGRICKKLMPLAPLLDDGDVRLAALQMILQPPQVFSSGLLVELLERLYPERFDVVGYIRAICQKQTLTQQEALVFDCLNRTGRLSAVLSGELEEKRMAPVVISFIDLLYPPRIIKLKLEVLHRFTLSRDEKRFIRAALNGTVVEEFNDFQNIALPLIDLSVWISLCKRNAAQAEFLIAEKVQLRTDLPFTIDEFECSKWMLFCALNNGYDHAASLILPDCACPQGMPVDHYSSQLLEVINSAILCPRDLAVLMRKQIKEKFPQLKSENKR